MFERSMGFPKSQILFPFASQKMIGSQQYLVQKKIHRKKRINKKWLKKYGYETRCIPFEVILEDCRLTPDKFNKNAFEISGKIVRE